MKYAIELSTAQSARVLQEACQSGQRAHVQPKAWQGRPLSATLISYGDEGLELEAAAGNAADLDLAALLNVYCNVDFELAGGQYFFESHVLTARWRDQQLHLSLAKPDTVLVQQRRRSRRAAIASSSAVQLSRQDGAQLVSCQGLMYNLSHEGLACQLSQREGTHLVMGDSWCVCFEVPEQSQWYKLSARVCRHIPSAAEGFVIVGMQFEHGQVNDDQLSQLQAFLAERQQARTQLTASSGKGASRPKVPADRGGGTQTNQERR